jgi:hypothetical protein
MEVAKREVGAFAKGAFSEVVNSAAKDRQTMDKLGSAFNDLKSGNFKKISQTIVQTAQNPQLANSRLKAVGSVMAHSGIGGIKNVGQTMKGVADASDSFINAVKGAPQFFSDTSDLLSGRTKTSKRDAAAGTVSGIGKTLYGSGAGTATGNFNQMMPGHGSDLVNYAVGYVQQKIDQGYRSDVKKLGVNPDSKGYQSSSNVAGVVTTVGMAAVSKFGPGLFKRTPKPGLVRTTPGKGASTNQLSGALNSKPSLHPVEGLKQAVQLHKEGKISSAKLNEAMSRASSDFKAETARRMHKAGKINDAALNEAIASASPEYGAQKGPWSDKMRKEYISHNVEANRLLGGAKPSIRTAAQPSTEPVRQGTQASVPNTPTPSTGLKPAAQATGSHPAASAAAPSQLERQTRQGTTSSGKPVTLKPVNPSFIKPLSQNIRAAFAENKAAKNADGVMQTTKGIERAGVKTESQRNGLGSIERRPGESMRDFLARNGVKSSLSAAQEAAADRAGLRMVLTFLHNVRDGPLENERSQTKHAGAEETKLMSQLRTLSNEHFERTIFNAPSSFRRNMLTPIIQEFERRGYMFRGDMRSQSEVAAAGGFTIANKAGASDKAMNTHDHLFNFMSTRSLVSEGFGRSGSAASVHDEHPVGGSVTKDVYTPPSGKRGYTYIIRPTFESDQKLSPRNLEPYDVSGRPEMKGPYDFYANGFPGIEVSNLRLQNSSIGTHSNDLDLRYLKADQLKQLGDAIIAPESEVRSVRDIPCVQIVGSFQNAEGQYSRASEENFRIGTFEPFEPRIGGNGVKYPRGGEIVKSQSSPAPVLSQPVDNLPKK